MENSTISSLPPKKSCYSNPLKSPSKQAGFTTPPEDGYGVTSSGRPFSYEEDHSRELELQWKRPKLWLSLDLLFSR